MENKTLRAGAATRIINCELGDDLAGLLERRICDRIRDDLEANFLYVSDDSQAVVIVSLDLLGFFEIAWIRETCAGIEAKTGIPARNVIITSTHTHSGPNTPAGLTHDTPGNEAYMEKLREWLIDGAGEAVSGARRARAGWTSGETHIGHNRRLCWSDGAHTMYGDHTRSEFTGVEGPDDPSHAVLFAVDEQGKYIALAHSNCCHATCLSNQTCMSADFPGEARAILRKELDPGLPVLYLQGASGDVSPWNMLKNGFHGGTSGVEAVGKAVAAETLRLMPEAEVADNPILGHVYEDVTFEVRLPSPEALSKAEEIRSMGEEEAGRWDYEMSVCGVLRLNEEFKDNPFDTLAVHAIRIGDFAMITNPCELYCRFGLDIKRRSPAKVTMVVQLADGFSGYCPTVYGFLGGGYSGEAIHWCRLEPHAGYKLVEVSAKLLHSLWKMGGGAE